MKKISFLLILTLLSIDVFSKCTSKGLFFWPLKQTINSNSFFVIEGYSESQDIVKKLGKAFKVYLKSNQEIVKLEVQELLVGEYRLTQAILKPEKKLSNGQEYELLIENLGEFANQVGRRNDSTFLMEKVKWTVLNSNNVEPTAWINEPKFEKSIYEMYGCGSSILACFSFSAKCSYEYLIKTTLKNISTGIEKTYYLFSQNDSIEVGQNMCSGEFDIESSEKFEVEFSLFDATGTLVKCKENRIVFKRPEYNLQNSSDY